jgi:hypothetical protein
MAEEDVKDYDGQARSRIMLQYRQSSKLLAFVDALMAPAQNIDDTLRSIPQLDDLDIAADVNLETTAELVGQFRELVNGHIIDDAELRILAKARITRNTAHATGPDLINILVAVFEAPVIFADYEGMAIGYAIGRAVTPDEAAILNSGVGGTILARPIGVFVTQQFFIASGDYFGFDDTPGAKTFGELNLPAPPGGPLSEIF